jgi:acetyltransferase-like isoleucine patch superfamily enzyme
MKLIIKFFLKISSISSRIVNRLDKKCAQVGSECAFTGNAKIYNHSNKIESIIIGNGVTIDGILEVYDKGLLLIDDYTFIGNSRIFCANQISIGKGCWIADHVFIMDSDLHPISPHRRLNDAKNFSQGIFPDVYTNIINSPTIIENSVWIGVNSIILKGVTLGEGVVVGAGSVVTKDVPAWTIVAGNPARVIREIPENER